MDGQQDQGLIDGQLDNAAADRLDEDGRPVGEVGSRRYAEVETELVACPYADARRGKPMNQSALRQLGAVWPQVLGAARALAGPDPTVHAVWAATLIGTALPLCVPADEAVPRVVSALYKTSLGMSQVFTALLLSADGLAETRLRDLGDGAAFFAMLDQDGWLSGQVQVCAGTPAMIGQMVDAWTSPAPTPALPAPVAALRPDRLREPILRTAALQVAGLALAARSLREGHPRDPDDPHLGAWLEGRGPSFLRGVLGVPNRPPEHALRLFAAGRAPDALLRSVASGPAPVRVLSARLRSLA